MSAARIVGIVLVRNEDLFVEAAVRNIVAFCDEIRVADHGSTDATPRILRSLAGSSPKIHVESISHPAASHALIRNLAGSATWVFAWMGTRSTSPTGWPGFAKGFFVANSTAIGCFWETYFTRRNSRGTAAPPADISPRPAGA